MKKKKIIKKIKIVAFNVSVHTIKRFEAYSFMKSVDRDLRNER